MSSTSPVLSPAQQALNDLWEEHLRHEFATKDTAATIDTMVDDARVNHVPVLTGGNGTAELRTFYARHFIPHMPPDYGRRCSERIYWDQASVLVQAGLLERGGLPVMGAEVGAKVLDPSLPTNALIARVRS